MPLQKQTISWPMSGGLDTKRSPLVIQPGSFLQVDNAIQERAGEWRRRNGFTQVAADTLTPQPYAVANDIGSGGVIAALYGFRNYNPAQTSNKWGPNIWGSPLHLNSTMTRISLGESDSTTIGMAASGSFRVVGHLTPAQTAPALTAGMRVLVHDRTSGATTVTNYFNGELRVRGAATATHAVLFTADGSGNLRAYVVTLADGSITVATIKTGLHTTQPYLDAIWYGGSTITVVARTSGDAIRFIEFNPSTGALATDTTIAGVSCASCLSLINDPTASGIRFIGNSHTTPTTRVTRVNSAGAVQTNDQAQAVTSTQITGIAYGAGANWTIVYKTTGSTVLNFCTKTGGVVGGVNTAHTGADLDSQGWADQADVDFRFLAGLHSTNADDPQDSWVEQQSFTGQSISVAGGMIVPLQGAAPLAMAASLYQQTVVGTRASVIALPVLSSYQPNAGGTIRKYSIDIFEQQLLTVTEVATQNIGRPVATQNDVFFPGQGVAIRSAQNPISFRQLGIRAPLKIPALSAGAGGALTPLALYQYAWFIEIQNDRGDIWRSPPSVPQSVTLSGAQNRVTVTMDGWQVEEVILVRACLYRTAANGSIPKRIYATNWNIYSSIVYVDDLADSAIVDGTVLYTVGELATSITPPAAHLCVFNDRLWIANRDYRTELWPSKNLRPGRQPEFPVEGVVDIDDDKGDITGLASLDDKMVVFKRNAIYFVTGDGLTDSGSGEAHRYTQISQDIGSIPGSPVVAAGELVYFVSDRGIYSVDRAGTVDFIGEPVDQFLSQPLVQTPETIYDAVFNPAKNWVYFITTNYILVHDRTLNYWMRWTGLSGMKRALVINNRLVLFKASDGTVWREGDHTQTTDQGVAYTGVIRSPWMSAAGEERGMRLYRARVDGARTAGGGSIVIPTSIYFNNDDAKVENYNSTAIAGGTLVFRGEMKPGQTQNQKCTSFSIAVTLPSSDVTLRIQRLTATVGVRQGKAELLPSSDGVVFS